MRAPDPVAFTVFGLDIMWYGLLIGCGFGLATIICYYRAENHGIKRDFILDLVIWMIPTAIIGARAYYVIFQWDSYAGDLMKILNIRNGGLAVHGGLLACFLVGYFVCRHNKVSFLKAADLIAPTIALAQSIGRWGNFFNEEAHGTITDLPWGQIINGVSYHPTFLYESIWCFCLFWFLLWMDKKHKKFDGQILCLYGILYSVERFCVEGLRTDSLMVGPLRQAQLISLAIIIVLAAVYFILHKKNNKI